MSEGVIFIQDARISFPHIAEPQQQTNNDGKVRISYNGDFILAQDHPGFQQFMQQYATMAQGKWPEHYTQVMQMIQTDRKLRCYGTGEEKINSKTFQPYDGYAGHCYITANSDRMPQVFSADGQLIDPNNTMAVQTEARRIYGGCRVNVAIKPWLQENSHGRGIRCDLVGIQFLRDDTPFGEGAPDVTGMFGQVAQAPAGSPTPAGAATPPAIPGMPGAAPTAPAGIPGMPGAAPTAPAGIPGMPPFPGH